VLDAMQWYREVQFVAGVPMKQPAAAELGVTVNGMWVGNETIGGETAAASRASNQRLMFSVPLIALTPDAYRSDEARHLLAEVCRDIEGNTAQVPWYYWESEPVYSACIYSPVFLRYIVDRCRTGIDRMMDAVNLDEINTSVGLMSQKPGDSGFCRYCLERFRRELARARSGNEEEVAPDPVTASLDDGALRARLKAHEALYSRYRHFHEVEAFHVVVRLIADLRAYATSRNPEFAITANVAYLGNNARTRGALWGPMWGEHIDFVMSENVYRPVDGGEHLLLPRGKFTAWYRLGSALGSRAPAWICPGIMVPRQLAGQRRTSYYELMFLEAYANCGRWAFNWWPGVDDEERYAATVPARLHAYIRFIAENRQYYERAESANDVAILYLDACISRQPNGHEKYLALAQALAEAGAQYDVIYVGDGRFSGRPLNLDQLTRYKALLIPEAGDLNSDDEETLRTYISQGLGEVVSYTNAATPGASAGSVRWREASDGPLLAFWTSYGEDDRRRVAATTDVLERGRLRSSDPNVNVIRWVIGTEQVLHLLNYNYDEATDQVKSVTDLRIRVPWPSGRSVACSSLRPGLLRPGREEPIQSTAENGDLVLLIPELDLYGLLIMREKPEARIYEAASR
jgi:hypothetical protein